MMTIMAHILLLEAEKLQGELQRQLNDADFMVCMLYMPMYASLLADLYSPGRTVCPYPGSYNVTESISVWQRYCRRDSSPCSN